jgi:hypothetical protein
MSGAFNIQLGNKQCKLIDFSYGTLLEATIEPMQGYQTIWHCYVYVADRALTDLFYYGDLHFADGLVFVGASYVDNTLFVVVNVDGVEHMIQRAPGESNKLAIIARDLRDNTQHLLKTIDLDGERFIQQTLFDADEFCENYWYIDSTHILRLTSLRFELWQAVDPYFEQWRVISFIPRAEWLDSEKDLRYGMSNATNQMPYFYRLSITRVGNRNNICVKYTTMRTDTLGGATWNTVTDIGPDELTVTTAGIALLTDRLSSFNKIDGLTVLNKARISATRVGNSMWLGIFLNKGLDQWVWKSNGSEKGSVFNGMGFVGPDGLITGNAIPQSNCHASGFDANVKKIKVNDAKTDNELLPDGVFFNEGDIIKIAGSWSNVVIAVNAAGGQTIVPLQNYAAIDGGSEAVASKAEGSVTAQLGDIVPPTGALGALIGLFTVNCPTVFDYITGWGYTYAYAGTWHICPPSMGTSEFALKDDASESYTSDSNGKNDTAQEAKDTAAMMKEAAALAASSTETKGSAVRVASATEVQTKFSEIKWSAGVRFGLAAAKTLLTAAAGIADAASKAAASGGKDSGASDPIGKGVQAAQKGVDAASKMVDSLDDVLSDSPATKVKKVFFNIFNNNSSIILTWDFTSLITSTTPSF